MNLANFFFECQVELNSENVFKFQSDQSGEKQKKLNKPEQSFWFERMLKPSRHLKLKIATCALTKISAVIPGVVESVEVCSITRRFFFFLKTWNLPTEIDIGTLASALKKLQRLTKKTRWLSSANQTAFFLNGGQLWFACIQLQIVVNYPSQSSRCSLRTCAFEGVGRLDAGLSRRQVRIDLLALTLNTAQRTQPLNRSFSHSRFVVQNQIPIQRWTLN